MPSIVVEVPRGLSITQLTATAHAVQDAVEQAIGVVCETNVDIGDLAVPEHEREPERDPSRQQECAADAMAAKHGRSRVRHLADGAVEITGMLDDIERETVCIERDGRERWRR